ncbi:MAG: M1 family metallopeptidase [Gemmatimonadota bacterium]
MSGSEPGSLRVVVSPEPSNACRPTEPRGRAWVVAAVALTLSACAGAPGSRPSAPPPSAEPAGVPAGPAAIPAEESGEGAPAPGVERRPSSDRAGVDVRHYDLLLDLRGLADRRLDARARLRVAVTEGGWPLRLDLAGLTVDSARLDGSRVEHARSGDVLSIRRSAHAAGGERPESGRGRRPSPGAGEASPSREWDLELFYHGVPEDGLVFAPDAEGRPTAFADNWPNRARWWFPANDHPSDKATLRLEVRVPAGYGAIANGHLVERSGEHWVWEERVPIPVYTMVVGAAPFAVSRLGEAACGRAPRARAPCTEVSVWSLAGDSAYGAGRFARAADMLDFYAMRIGPYPYEKLAHVESSTRFGGMENSSAIFYAQAPWAGRRMREGVIAHETAHQWFGDSVTPADWPHLWLSEGFATYLTVLYFEARDGPEAARARLEAARRAYLDSEVTGLPVVPSRAPERLFDLLNPNSYQKGAWFLHMLRAEVGDSVFFGALREYYAEHADGTAVTRDFRLAVERASGRALDGFFDQWLYRPGYPRLEIEWRETTADRVEVEVRQVQPADWPTFRLPLVVELRGATGRAMRRTLPVHGRSERFPVSVPFPVTELHVDPDGRLLLEATVDSEPPAGRAGSRVPS